MPNIHGLAALIALVFAPCAELRFAFIKTSFYSFFQFKNDGNKNFPVFSSKMLS